MADQPMDTPEEFLLGVSEAQEKKEDLYDPTLLIAEALGYIYKTLSNIESILEEQRKMASY